MDNVDYMEVLLLDNSELRKFLKLDSNSTNTFWQKLLFGAMFQQI